MRASLCERTSRHRSIVIVSWLLCEPNVHLYTHVPLLPSGLRVHTHTKTHTYTNTNTHTRTKTHTQTQTHQKNKHTHTNTNTHKNTYTHKHKNTRTHTHTQTHTHTHIYIYIGYGLYVACVNSNIIANTIVGVKNIIFWDVESCGFIINQRFGGTCRLHLQGRRNNAREEKC
jgi:hypothetical protein